jgi:uroporphyrinogen-III decarboxylase
MLTTRQNLMETIKGGHPDRFVKQYEFMELMMDAPMDLPLAPAPGMTVKNKWGITFSWREDQIGSYPVHDNEHRVLKDIKKWRETVKAPSVNYSEEEWASAIAHANAVDRKDKFVTAVCAPGIFEMTHHLMGVEDGLANLIEEPELMHELIDYIAEYEVALAAETVRHIHPDAVFHHDDWGSQISTIFSPATFREFLLPAYKKVYGFWKANGVELIVHHSDCYAATLVPMMIEAGIDIWQGCMTTNNVPELIKNYGGKISFMGDIDSGKVDNKDWTREEIAKNVETACRECGKQYYIPCLVHGLNISNFPGVYETINEEIDRMSKAMF